LKKKIERHKSVMQRIADGTLFVRSEKEFENLLRIFPEHPILLRTYGDFLARQKELFKAADAYARAASLFIEEAVPLQSIVAKVLEWRILKPQHEEVIAFHSALSRIRSEEKPALNFWTQLSYAELLSFMLKLTLIRFSPDKYVKKAFKEESNLFFVVSGALRETFYPPEGSAASEPMRRIDHVENDFFGSIFPFRQQSMSFSDVQTLTRVELIKIPSTQLISICEKHPNLHVLMEELYLHQNDSTANAPRQTVRRTVRHHLPTQVSLKVFREDRGQSPLVLEGFADNISLGGACVFLEKHLRQSALAQMTGRNVRLVMKLLSAEVDLKILGEIVWIRDLEEAGQKRVALGIQFQTMTDPDRELLQAYCTGGEGEQNLMWGLWESLVKK